MNDLAADVLDSHGGLKCWHRWSTVTATIVSGGELFLAKGLPQDPTPRQMTVSLHEEHASVRPFGADDQRTDFTPDRIAVEKLDGTVVAERRNPRDAFRGHILETPWDPLDRAYFNGYALWTYLTTPFLISMPGFAAEEAEPWQEGTERWRHLRVTFPDGIASHCGTQDFYFGEDGLLRRHDYHVDIAGGFAAAQYVHDFVRVQGISLPTKRRAYLRDVAGRPVHEHLMVSIDLSDVRFFASTSRGRGARS
ncbi:hypothetical protein [Streptomyces sp. NPDC047079]|uniref:hypothetical protein n=1 Tax=Streptomyces sp. NPDC047079 TaxID=3154607 RepID=UPI0033CA94DB